MSGVFIISGPTASGKSALALRIAEERQGEIVSIDSVQVYKGCDIGSAKPTEQDRRRVPHHLLDCLGPGAAWNAGEHVTRAWEGISQIQRSGKEAIVVAGTNLYLSMLLHGIAAVPRASADVRRRLEACSTEELYEQLTRGDPSRAKELHPNDRVRILRALEIFALGHKPSEARGAHAYAELRYPGSLIVVLGWKREDLYRRIDARVDQMLECGLIEESKRLLDTYGVNSPVFRALGYSSAIKHLRGGLDRRQTRDEIALLTRRFAKRQVTYWRNEPLKRGWTIECGTADEPKPVTTLEIARAAGELRGSGVRVWFVSGAELSVS